MSWIKHVLLDLIVTMLMVLAVFMDQDWARWIVLVYTPLMVLLKLLALLGSRTMGQLQTKPTGVPEWVFHVLYATNILIALVGKWWPIAAGWALIWGLSFATDRRMRLFRKK